MRRSAFVAATSAAALFAPSAARAARTPSAGASLDGRTPIPVVRARAGARELLVAFDSAMPNSMLSIASAAALGIAGSTLAGLAIGTTPLRDHPLATGALDRWNALAGFALDGVLGYEAFRDQAVTIDYRNGRLGFPDEFPDGEVTPITWLRYADGRPQLLTFDDLAVDGFPVVAVLDTMMSKSAVIFAAKVPDLAIDNDLRARPYDYAGEGLRPGRVGSIRIGTTTLATRVTVYGADARADVPASAIALIAGDALFARRALTIDIPGSRLIVG